jgi:hypothetical protein
LPRAQHCFKDDAGWHLRSADAPINEHDRRFDEAKASTVGAVFALNLKSVLLVLHRLAVYGFEHPTVQDVIPTGGSLDRQSEKPAGIKSTGLADAAPDDTPMP